ncbi:MAG: DNA-binding transcriptional MerR regulator [Flavobacteriales bacterium]|jgi:DNA-binding transcriptional MerR regulator
MGNKIKNSFTIHDLELLCGIKAHTIRIWEKRYDLLSPERLNRNIRMYSLADLQKLLNVTALYEQGYKISKIAELDETELSAEVKTVALEEVSSNHRINSLVISMYTLDERLFEEIYADLISQVSFEKVFFQTYLPLMKHIGVLWQTNVILPAHEHFISNLIFQKVLLHTALLEANFLSEKLVHVLFLPKGEVHELGLLFLNYHLKSKGKRTVYLGRDIPIEDLMNVNGQFNEIVWHCHATIDIPKEIKNEFVEQISGLIQNNDNKCILIGKIWQDLNTENLNKSISIEDNLETALKKG